jgi:hypothetical protein
VNDQGFKKSNEGKYNVLFPPVPIFDSGIAIAEGAKSNFTPEFIQSYMSSGYVPDGLSPLVKYSTVLNKYYIPE